jgi:hypothetical protein
MGKNLNKSRRNWITSGYCRCDECGELKYHCVLSERPTHIILCPECWDWIYVQDRQGDRRQPRFPGF